MIVTRQNVCAVIAALYNNTGGIAGKPAGGVQLNEAVVEHDLGEKLDDPLGLIIESYRGRKLMVTLNYGHKVCTRLYDSQAGYRSGEEALQMLRLKLSHASRVAKGWNKGEHTQQLAEAL